MKKPKILIYDIETSPLLGYAWQKYEVNLIGIKKHSQILSISWKWFGETPVYCLTSEGKKDDKQLVKKLSKLFGEADILVAHNGDKFDKKKTNASLIKHLLPPPQQTPSVDTLKVAKAYFAFTGNSLADLGGFLKVGKKAKHPGFDMWLGCMAGNAKSWKQMAYYNQQDVVLLEKVYERFRPWILNHPNIGKIINPNDKSLAVHPACGSKNVIRNGYRVSGSQVKQRWECRDCSGTFVTKYVKETR